MVFDLSWAVATMSDGTPAYACIDEQRQPTTVFTRNQKGPRGFG
jgi:hypothetical protein